MAGDKIDVQIYLNAVKAEADLFLTTIRDKGPERFGKTFGLSALVIAVAYFGIYGPPQKKIARLQKEIDSARAMSESATSYRNLREQLMNSYGTLPHIKDRQQWLSNAMIDSLRADNLIPETFRPVTEMEASGLIFQTSTVQLTINFKDLYAWLIRLEGATPLMHVSALEVGKKPNMLGWNAVTASVMTAIPKKRFN